MTIRYIEPGDGDPRHGTMNGYQNLRCRCTACRGAWAEYCEVRRRKREGSLAADDPRHGRANTYNNYRCRCAACTAAHVDYCRDYIRRKREATA